MGQKSVVMPLQQRGGRLARVTEVETSSAAWVDWARVPAGHNSSRRFSQSQKKFVEGTRKERAFQGHGQRCGAKKDQSVFAELQVVWGNWTVVGCGGRLPMRLGG